MKNENLHNTPEGQNKHKIESPLAKTQNDFAKETKKENPFSDKKPNESKSQNIY